jgi:hypothetical protein
MFPMAAMYDCNGSACSSPRTHSAFPLTYGIHEFPDDFMHGRHLENVPAMSRTNERIAVGQPLHAALILCINIFLF